MYVYVDFSFDTSVKQIFNDKLFKICLTNYISLFSLQINVSNKLCQQISCRIDINNFSA